MSVRKLLAAVLLAASCNTTSYAQDRPSNAAAFAEDRGFYIGASGGQSKPLNPAECSDLFGLLDTLVSPGAPVSCKADTKAGGWKVFAGYQINKYLAFETSYVDLGSFKLSANNSAPASVQISFHPTGFSADWVGSLPIAGGFALMARVGAFAWTLDAPANLTLSVGSSTFALPLRNSHTGTNLDLGAGAKFEFNKTFSVRIEFQRFKDIFDDDFGKKTDFNLISAGAALRFN